MKKAGWRFVSEKYRSFDFSVNETRRIITGIDINRDNPIVEFKIQDYTIILYI